ncbi:MAG: hypothetical protein H6817_09695 [Phycisphaerales bacterium]|nr:hypothetical protein [Phycisphaerales bacterium]
MAVVVCALGVPLAADGAVFNIADGDSNGLIDAINVANANGEPDVINLATNGMYVLKSVVYNGDYFPGNLGTDRDGLPPIVSEITINGLGATISRIAGSDAPDFRILQVGKGGAPGDLSLSDLTISNGRSYSSGGGVAVYEGSAEFVDCVLRGNWVAGTSCAVPVYGGGLFNNGSCLLANCRIVDNRATRGSSSIPPNCGDLYSAAGVYNQGAMEIVDCEFDTNHANALGNGGDGELSMAGTWVHGHDGSDVIPEHGGNAVFNDHPAIMTITGCRFDCNDRWCIENDGTLHVEMSDMGENGGGVFNRGLGDLSLESCDIHNNGPRGGLSWGYGGVVNEGIATIGHSRIRNNDAGDGPVPGGLGVFRTFGIPVQLDVFQCEISGNQGRYGGGGLAVRGDYSASSNNPVVTITNSTISNNEGEIGGGGLSARGFCEVSVRNSTIAGNLGGGAEGILLESLSGYGTPFVDLQNVLIGEQASGAGCLARAGTIVSRGHNLDSDGTCNLDSNGDISFGFANLGPLADNGGPTFTHALLPGSDAIDAGSSAACLADPVGGVDQRGYARSQGLACDIGAFEVGDFDDDGVIDGVDVCLSPAGAVVNNAGGPLGDIDDDCAVTLADFVYFEVCLYLSGPEVSPLFSDCADVFDFDDDGDVDLVDYAFMQTVM